MYITNISHITQSDKDKIFDKTKTIRPKTWSIDFTKKRLMAYHLPKSSLHRLLSQFSPSCFFFCFGRGGGGTMAPPWPYVGPSLHIRVIWVSNGLYLMCHARCFHVWIFVRTKPNQPRPVSLLTSSASLPRPRISRRFTEVSVNLLL